MFLAGVMVLVVAARVGGELAARLRIPPVTGEILLGIALGPTLLGRLWPGAFTWLFPAGGAGRDLLDGMAWIGILFLVAVSGLETRLGLLRHSGRAVILASTGGFMLPFGAGLFFGLHAPATFVGAGVDRPVFALFVAIAMAISAIPVAARILLDLDAYRTRTGMVIMSSALAADTVGWLLLGLVSGLLGAGALSTGAVWWAVAGTALFLVAASTIGRAGVAAVIRACDRSRLPHAQATAMLALILAGGVVTQAIGVHLVLGAFVVAILLGRTAGVRPEALVGIRQVGFGFFTPIFFAYAGVKADLGSLEGAALVATVIALAIACASKLIGGGVGARLGGLPRWEAMAVGVGLTARGAMELVIATIGLALGVLSEGAYSMLVVVAVLTSILAGPLLRICLSRAGVQATSETLVVEDAIGGIVPPQPRREGVVVLDGLIDSGSRATPLNGP